MIFDRFSKKSKSATNIADSRPFSDVTISNPSNGLSYSAKALWSTGTMVSLISPKVAELLRMDIIPNRKNTVLFEGEVRRVGLCTGRITIQGKQLNIEIGVTDICDAESVIGMDVITKGVFSISNAGGKTEFIFRMPPKGKVGG